MALALVSRGTVTAHVLQVGPFLSAPSVIMAEPFGQVTLDGKPWCYVHGQTVYLPRAKGVYRIETRGVSAAPSDRARPALARTSAHVASCRFVAESRVLEVYTVANRDDPEAEYTAWFTGDVPDLVEGGELVSDQELTYRDDQARTAAEAGVMVRFQAGLLRLHYR